MCLLSWGGHIYRGKCTAVHRDDPSKDDYNKDDAGNKLGTLYTIRYIDEQQNGQKLSEDQLEGDYTESEFNQQVAQATKLLTAAGLFQNHDFISHSISAKYPILRCDFN